MEGAPQNKPSFFTRIYRKHIAAPIKEMEYGLRGFEDMLSAVDEADRKTLLNVTVIPAIDKGILALRAGYEKKRFEEMQSDKGASGVARQHKRISRKERVRDDAQMRETLGEETYAYECDERVAYINELLQITPALSTMLLHPNLQPERLLLAVETLETVVGDLNEAALRKHQAAESVDKDGHFEYHTYYEEVANKLKELKTFIAEQEKKRKTLSKKAVHASQALDKEAGSNKLPRTRLFEHERLDAQRESFSSLVHNVQLRRLVARRKMEELEDDIHELKNYRDPAVYRAERERLGARNLQAELAVLATQAERFANIPELENELRGTDRVRKLEELGRRPRVYDAERLLVGASMPEELRKHLLFMLKTSSGPRYSFVTATALEKLTTTIERVLNPEEEEQQEEVIVEAA